MKDLNIKIKKLVIKCSKARLYEQQIKKEALNKETNSKTDIGWGHQIRSYVLQPYQQKKI